MFVAKQPQSKDLKIKLPPELKEIEQQEVAIAIGDSIYTLHKATDKVGKEAFIDIAKAYSLAGIADLRARYIRAIEELEKATNDTLREFISRLPDFGMIYKEGIMVSVKRDDFGHTQLKVIMPFKLKVEYAENRKILSPKIERDVHIRFDIQISRGSYYTISHAELVKWNGEEFDLFPHYHLMKGNYTCWGSYRPDRNIRSFTELIEIRNEIQWLLRNIGHQPHSGMNFKGLPAWHELTLGKGRVILEPWNVHRQLQTEKKVAREGRQPRLRKGKAVI